MAQLYGSLLELAKMTPVWPGSPNHESAKSSVQEVVSRFVGKVEMARRQARIDQSELLELTRAAARFSQGLVVMVTNRLVMGDDLAVPIAVLAGVTSFLSDETVLPGVIGNMGKVLHERAQLVWDATQNPSAGERVMAMRNMLDLAGVSNEGWRELLANTRIVARPIPPVEVAPPPSAPAVPISLSLPAEVMAPETPVVESPPSRPSLWNRISNEQPIASRLTLAGVEFPAIEKLLWVEFIGKVALQINSRWGAGAARLTLVGMVAGHELTVEFSKKAQQRILEITITGSDTPTVSALKRFVPMDFSY